uniref:Uncharacterized protein n=1 Tax=Opuntia streptacantha TaxID=393608 RepID=A0A7C9ENT3_OPUST
MFGVGIGPGGEGVAPEARGLHQHPPQMDYSIRLRSSLRSSSNRAQNGSLTYIKELISENQFGFVSFCTLLNITNRFRIFLISLDLSKTYFRMFNSLLHKSALV